MSQTACWALNNTTDCAWCTFGYGSRYDMLFGYKYGRWLSLEALKMIAYYDYDQTEHYKDHGFPVRLAKQVGFQCNPAKIWYNEHYKCDFYCVSTDEELEHLHPKLKMYISAVTIKHKDAGKWYEEYEKASGGFLRDYPDYKQKSVDWKGYITYHSECIYTESIKDFNVDHYNAIKRMYEMEQRAKDSCDVIYSWFGQMTKEQDKSMRVTDEQMKKLLDWWEEDREKIELKKTENRKQLTVCGPIKHEYDR